MAKSSQDRRAASKRYMQGEDKFSGRYSPEVFETLRFAYGKHLKFIIMVGVLGLLGRMLLLSNANIIGVWVDTFCRAPSTCRPVATVFAGLTDTDFLKILLVVTSLGFVLAAFFRLKFSRMSARAVSQLYDEVTWRTSRYPIRFFDTTPVGAVVTRFSSDYGNVFRLFGGPLAEFLIIIFDLIGMFILVTVASIWFLPVFVGIGLLNYLVYRLNLVRLRDRRRETSAARSPALAHFNETAQGASTVRVFSRQDSFIQRFRALNGTYLRHRLSAFATAYGFSLQMNALGALLLLVTGLAGYFLADAGWVSVGSIGVAFTFVALSTGSMQMFFEWMAQFEETMTGVERLNQYLRRDLEGGLRLPIHAQYPTKHPKESELTREHRDASAFATAPSVEIRAERLWFRYQAEGPWILKDIDFVIRPGERVGIVGRTGSGKSSLIQALFRLYPIERGRLLVDGFEPILDGQAQPGEKQVDLELYRRAIALIAQEPILFRGSVRENLALGEGLSDEKMRQALERVGLTSWLMSQPEGLGAQIEERGRNLSLGERQLLCMARCLLQNSPVVVMDEATSAIDPQSEEILVRATDEFFCDRTQLIIAHRLSTLESCDRILWIRDGSVYRFDSAPDVLRELRQASAQDILI